MAFIFAPTKLIDVFFFFQNTNLGYQKICNEAESLRTVLELKSSEMQDLRKQNEKLQREVEDFPTIVQKLEAAQSRVEDLNVQLQRKSEIEMYVYFLQVFVF